MSVSKGMIPTVINNEENVYAGNLKRYFATVFFNAQNLFSPYHNFRHMFHVTWLCYMACKFYKSGKYGYELSPRECRNLMIAAMFHDMDHSGIMGSDDLNIEKAIDCLGKYILDIDRKYFSEIADIINRGTRFPHLVQSNMLPLAHQIIRDADMSQALSVAWIQQVVFGLAREWNKKPLDVLKMQVPFLSNLKFHTDWAQVAFPQSLIDEKVKEAADMIAIIEEMSQSFEEVGI